jgi:hypothetical protein
MALSKVNPRSRFVASEPNRAALEKLTNTDWFLEAVQSALASYIRNITLNEEDPDASAKFHAIRGAREFSEILLTMADRPKTGDGAKIGELNHNVK